MEYRLRENEFLLFKNLIYDKTSINLDKSKISLLENRLAKRLRHYEFSNFKEYFDYLNNHQNSKELQLFIDLITTNETSFFRENPHFEFLEQKHLPTLEKNKKLNIWSAACSSGEEAYTLGMVLEKNKFNYEILGTDISERILESAKKGVFPIERSIKIPSKYLKEFCLKGKNEMEGFFKFDKKISEKLNFKYFNLNMNFDSLPTFDIIFLRNVMIYFDQKTKDELVFRITNKLKKGGLFFIGMAETLIEKNSKIKMISPSIYRKLE